jgi:hypothetical protein
MKTSSSRSFAAVVMSLAASTPALTSGPRDITPQGAYIHLPSGMRFPEQAADFVRERVLQFDSVGNDVGIGYNRETPGRQVAATVYVYPLPKRTFDDELADVTGAHPRARVGTREAVVLERNGQKADCNLAGLSFEDVFAGERGPVTSYLLVCDRRPWRITWRFTHRDPVEVADLRELAATLTLQK